MAQAKHQKHLTELQDLASQVLRYGRAGPMEIWETGIHMVIPLLLLFYNWIISLDINIQFLYSDLLWDVKPFNEKMVIRNGV